MLGPEKWRHVDSFIEDGKLMMNRKLFAMAGNKVALDKGHQGLAADYFDSFSTDKQGNLVRKLICSFPIANIKITKVMSAIRVVSSDNENYNVRKRDISQVNDNDNDREVVWSGWEVV